MVLPADLLPACTIASARGLPNSIGLVRGAHGGKLGLHGAMVLLCSQHGATVLQGEESIASHCWVYSKPRAASQLGSPGCNTAVHQQPTLVSSGR